jgi:hypothetical protein
MPVLNHQMKMANNTASAGWVMPVPSSKGAAVVPLDLDGTAYQAGATRTSLGNSLRSTGRV